MIVFDTYLVELKEDLLNTYLGLWPTTKIGNKDYDRLADYIKEGLIVKLSSLTINEKLRLGLTVSPSTIERILTNTYKIKYLADHTIHPECEKILNKVAIFLGHKNWYDFVNKKQATKVQLTDTENEIVSFISEAILKRYRFLEEQTTSAWGRLNDYYYIGDGAFLAAFQEVELLKQHGVKIKVEGLNIFIEPFEILTDKIAVIHTKEYCKIRKGKGRLPQKAYNITIHQSYILIKDDEKWKITKQLLGQWNYESVFLMSIPDSNKKIMIAHDTLAEGKYINLK